jgi:hypothetical protein
MKILKQAFEHNEYTIEPLETTHRFQVQAFRITKFVDNEEIYCGTIFAKPRRRDVIDKLMRGRSLDVEETNS